MPTTASRSLVHYDTVRRRLWLRGQRCHHGVTGLVLALTGIVLVAHDWHDRQIWFERGWGTQP